MQKNILNNKRHFSVRWLILSLALLSLGGVMSYSLARQHSLIDALERVRLANLTKVLDANIGHQLGATNRALVGIRDEMPYLKTKEDGKSRTNRRLRAMSDAMPGVRTINVINAAGIVVASNRDDLIGRNFAERDYFKASRQDPDPAMLYVSPPFKTALGVFGLNLLRVVTGPKGEFAGIVAATLDPDYFNILLESVLYAPDMRVSVNHSDGKVFLIAPNRKDVEGMDLAKPGTFHSRHVESKQIASLFTGTVYATGDERMITIRTIKSDKFVADKPLMVAISRDMPAIFAAWRNEVFAQGGLFGVLAFVAVFGLYIYQRREQKFARTETGFVAKLQESEEKFSKAFQTSPYAITITRPEDGTFVEVNDAFTSMTGFTREEGIASSSIGLKMWVNEEDRQRVVAALRAGQAVVGKEHLFRTKSGKVITGLFSAQVIHLSQGNCILSSINDITERRLAEDALRESEKEFRLLAESMPQIVWITRPDGWNIYFNQQWMDYTGLTLEESYGHGWNKPFHPDDQQRAWEAWQNATKHGTVYSLDCRLRRADGVYTWWLIRGVPMKDAQGNILKWFGTCTDIDDIMRAEKEIKRLNAELEQRVRDRTALLEAANKELESFSYSVSHDLRAPLRHIDGYVDLLVSRCRDGLGDKGLHYVDTIADSARQMGVLIDNLLQFSRTGRVEMRREALEMNKPLQEALSLLNDSTQGRKIEWVIDELPSARGDYALLRQVWTNLLDNAVKYTRTKEIAKIEVGARKEEEQTLFYIKDNGVGFDMRHAGKLFGVFQRLHSLEEFEGTGIGLANVKRIITRHGGQIWAEAALNQGATFYFTLPKSKGEQHA